MPWQMLALEQGFDILVVELNEDGTLDGEMFEAHLARNPSLWRSPTSPMLGHRERREALDSRAHDAGATVLVDGHNRSLICRSTCATDVDFYMFSGHKTYGPRALGFCTAKRPCLTRCRPIAAAER